MEEGTVCTVQIRVNISWDPEARRYFWTYTGEGVHPTSGNLKLTTPGRTAIIYELDEESAASYQLIYVNLDAVVCATRQIEHVHIHQKKNAITIIDRNDYGVTRDTPFSLRLVARRTEDIASGFISADPQVTNTENTLPGGI